jgi:hypothetical protein
MTVGFVFVALGIILLVTFCGGLIVAIVGMLCLMTFDKVADGFKALRRRLA